MAHLRSSKSEVTLCQLDENLSIKLYNWMVSAAISSDVKYVHVRFMSVLLLGGSPGRTLDLGDSGLASDQPAFRASSGPETLHSLLSDLYDLGKPSPGIVTHYYSIGLEDDPASHMVSDIVVPV